MCKINETVKRIALSDAMWKKRQGEKKRDYIPRLDKATHYVELANCLVIGMHQDASEDKKEALENALFSLIDKLNKVRGTLRRRELIEKTKEGGLDEN